jgi:hypothetical protein
MKHMTIYTHLPAVVMVGKTNAVRMPRASAGRASHIHICQQAGYHDLV